MVRETGAAIPATELSTDHLADSQREALTGRIFQSVLGMMDILTIYLGDRLSLYRALADLESATPSELASRTGTAERYVREWLEQQAVAGILEVDGRPADATLRRYRLPLGHREVLLDADSLSYLTPLARAMVGVQRPLTSILDAFRSGKGVPYADYGPDAREGIAEANRPMFLHLLTTQWLPAIPETDARLRAEPPARVADIGCGSGWSSIAMARAYPAIHVDGFDLDAPSIATARANATSWGLSDRVSFHVADASDLALTGQYDLTTVFECLHDMSHPVEALRSIRNLLAEGGSALIGDERVADEFVAPGDDLEKLNYGFSVLHCLPAGMVDEGSAGTGTVMRPSTLYRYAMEAGFREMEVLPIEHELWRFYRLAP